MKKNNILLFLSILFFGLYSCSDDDKKIIDNDTKGKLVDLQSTINSQASVENGDSLWVKNTMVGVYALQTAGEPMEGASNLRYFSPQGKSLLGPANMYNDIVTFPENGSAIDLVAYRPYSAAVENGLLNIDLTKQAKPTDIDLLYSNNLKGIKEDQEAVADFAHVLSKMIFRISLGDDIQSVVGMELKLSNFKTKGTFDILNGTIVTGATDAVGAITSKITFTSGVSYAEAIVFPSVEANRNVSLKFGQNTAEITLPANFEMKANKQYVFDLKVSKETFSLSDEIAEEDWMTNSAAKIVLDPLNQANGEAATPFLVYQTKEKVDQKGAWIAGLIVDYKFPNVAGVAGSDYIVLKDIADSSDSTKYLLVDIKGSPVADRLDIHLIPDLVGMRVSIKGDLAASTANQHGVKLINVVAEKGGGQVSGPVTEFLFDETFGVPAAGEENSRPQLDAYTGYDMKSPVVYNVLEAKGTTLRFTDNFPDNGFYIWMPKDAVMDLSIENIQSKDYYDMKLMFDMASGDATAKLDALTIKCNGVDLKLPSNKVKQKDKFETVSVKIPNGTTTIQIIKPGEISNGHFRVDNIKIEGTIVK